MSFPIELEKAMHIYSSFFLEKMLGDYIKEEQPILSPKDEKLFIATINQKV